MNFFVLFAMALVAIASGDVAHLNNMYLPPHDSDHEHQHQQQPVPQHVAEYVQQASEIPAPSVYSANQAEPLQPAEWQQPESVPQFEYRGVEPEPAPESAPEPAPESEPEPESVPEPIVYAPQRQAEPELEEPQQPANLRPTWNVEESYFQRQPQPGPAPEAEPEPESQPEQAQEPQIDLRYYQEAPAEEQPAPIPSAELEEESRVYEPVSNGIDTVYGSNGGYVY